MKEYNYLLFSLQQDRCGDTEKSFKLQLGSRGCYDGFLDLFRFGSQGFMAPSHKCCVVKWHVTVVKYQHVRLGT